MPARLDPPPPGPNTTRPLCKTLAPSPGRGLRAREERSEDNRKRRVCVKGKGQWKLASCLIPLPLFWLICLSELSLVRSHYWLLLCNYLTFILSLISVIVQSKRDLNKLSLQTLILFHIHVNMTSFRCFFLSFPSFLPSKLFYCISFWFVFFIKIISLHGACHQIILIQIMFQ